MILSFTGFHPTSALAAHVVVVCSRQLFKTTPLVPSLAIGKQDGLVGTLETTTFRPSNFAEAEAHSVVIELLEKLGEMPSLVKRAHVPGPDTAVAVSRIFGKRARLDEKMKQIQ
ncbi:hypothetical protein Aduo_011502 [Ancylostoma duodenale]